MASASARPLVVLAAVAAVTVASLALPVTLAFDPWAWLVWGREVGRLSLDTTGGPSWKPFPVLLTTLIAPAGDAAPLLWLAIARALSLLALVGVYRLAERLAGASAGIVAAALLLLTPDTGSRFLRLLFEGHSATVGVTFAVWAIVRHLDGARSQALLLSGGFALIRPEAWPFLGAYALWLWIREPSQRPLVAAVLAGVPLLWFGADWWGSGSPWHGAGAAQVASGDGGSRLSLALERAWKAVPLPVWPAAALSALMAAPRSVERALGAMLLAWTALVVVMAGTLGYAALSRFYLPAGALACVLAGTAVPGLVGRVRPGTARTIAVAAVVVASLPALVPRVAALDVLFEEARTRHRLAGTLDEAIDDAGGRDAVLACGGVALDQAGLGGPLRPGLAWKLDIPLHDVGRRLGGRGGVFFARSGGRAESGLLASDRDGLTVLGGSADWAVYAAGCGGTGD